MDISRRAYSVDCRFFRDNPVISRVRWMEALPTAQVLPFESVILSTQQEPDDWLESPVGEVAGAPRTTTLAKVPAGITGNHICGTETDFREGGTYDPELPPVRYNSQGFPLCCAPALPVSGGPGFGGRVGVEVWRGRYVYGGAGAGGRCDIGMWEGLFIFGGYGFGGSCSVTTWRGLYVYGGGGAGGECTISQREGIKVYGGAGAGGRVRWNDLVEWVRDVHGIYEFTAEITGAHIIDCWGAGAGGQTNVDFGTFGAGGGGGGGAYARSVIDLTEGITYDIEVGQGTDARGDGVGAQSNPSTFDFSVVKAVGGYTGFLSNPGDGGREDDCIGDVRFSGGHGGSGVGLPNAGGGGGSGGPVSDGNDATGITGASPVYGGGGGGDGQNSVNSWDGYSPGGGSGGFAQVPSAPTPKAADGKVRIQWLPEE